jgi:hypothetical protein
MAAITAAALVGTSLPSAYAADEIRGTLPSAAVVGFRSGNPESDGKARQRLAGGLESSRRVRLIPQGATDRVVEGIWGEDRLESLALIDKAYKDFQEGKRLYGQLSLEEAIRSLSASVRGYREGIASLRENRFLLLSHLYLGIALTILGKEAEGEKYIREMIVLDPQRKGQKLSAREFSPRILDLHRAMTEDLLRQPMGEIIVESQPEGATVIFDGVVQKTTPLRIAEVPVGEHYIVLERSGYRQYSKRLNVEAGPNLLNVTLNEWRPFAPYAAARRSEPAGIDRLGRIADSLGAHVLVLADLTPGSGGGALLTGQLFDARTMEFSRIERADAIPGGVDAAGDELARKLLRHVTRDGSVLADLAEPSLPAEPDATPPERFQEAVKGGGIFRQWWFWTALAVIAGGGAFLLFGRTSPQYNTLKVTR